MRIKLLILVLGLFLATGCSQDATDAYNSDGDFSASDINGTWKESNSGFTVRISGVGSSAMGSGTVIATGTAMPSGATGGTCMTEVEYHDGGYWDAYNWTYFDDGSWNQTSVIGLAMSDDKSQFLIGSAVYRRQ